MIYSYSKIAIRNVIRNPIFSLINILGLALGIACSLLIFLWIGDEVSIGRHADKGAHLYRIMEREFTDGKVVADEDTPGLLADELKKQFPEVLLAAGFSWQESHLLSVGDKVARQSGCYAGKDWFKLYPIPLLAGRPATALDSPKSLAISHKLASLYFGGATRALGQTIRFDNANEYQVTAVFEDLPANAPEKYEFLLNWQDFLSRNPWAKDWTNGGPKTRILLRPDADIAQFEAKLKWFLKGRNTDFGPTFYIHLFLQAEEDAYLYSNFKDGYAAGGRIEYVQLLGIVAIFLLVIAGINFMNLATARSVKRAREVGIRKVVGAQRLSLIGQFMGEALLLTSLAFLLALALVGLLLPYFNQLVSKQLLLPLSEPSFFSTLLGLLIFMSFLTGSYPALFLSSLNPVGVLKGTLRFGPGARLFRRGLVVFQFVLSMLLMVGTVIIYQQLDYIQTKNLGYERENLITIPAEGELIKNYPAFKQELLAKSGIQAISYMYANPLGNGNTTESVTWPGKDPNSAISFHNTAVGYDFAKTMKVNFIAGRDFSPAFGTDSTNYLINQAAAKRMGFQDPVGQSLTFWDKPGKIVGLIEDFHFNSLHEPIHPLIIRLADGYYGNILVRTQPGQTRQAVASIETLYKKLNPTFPFTYSFVDSGYEQLYQSEAIVGTLSRIFAAMAIFIACLGLFGLAAFMAEQRSKEIGVRKVLGASVASIVGLLSGDFLKLVLIAIVIASPIAWYNMKGWLEGFAYQIDISFWVIGLAGLLALVIALLTVSFQAIKAALMNPVKTLRRE
jgi:ABC-type antimicrobial peptide transport system permease subunit